MAPAPLLPTDSCSLLTVILDLSPLSWADAASGADGGDPLSLQAMIAQILIFLNANLASKAGNGLAVWGVRGSKSTLLYASTEETPEDHQRPDPNMYEPFRVMNDSITRKVEEVMALEEGEGSISASTSLVTALCKALCYINRLHHSPAVSTSIAMGVSSNGSQLPPSRTGTTSSSAARTAEEASHNARILIVSASEEESSGYVSLMNCIFSAQKARIIIDVCKLAGSEAIFLQQASHLTGGTYLRIPQRSALLQYLMMSFLPSRPLRRLILLPSQDRVDFRAACFCHKNIVDVGYVCSVCLSIFCKPVPICSTCKTRFPMSTLQALGFSMPKVTAGSVASRALNGGGSAAASRSASPASR